MKRLHKEGDLPCTVIDCYSVKPLVKLHSKKGSSHLAGNKMITVEDHYREGGLGEAITYELRNEQITITCLAVTKLPRSGKPQELRAYEAIDATAIVSAVLALHS